MHSGFDKIYVNHRFLTFCVFLLFVPSCSGGGGGGGDAAEEVKEEEPEEEEAEIGGGMDMFGGEEGGDY